MSSKLDLVHLTGITNSVNNDCSLPIGITQGKLPARFPDVNLFGVSPDRGLRRVRAKAFRYSRHEKSCPAPVAHKDFRFETNQATLASRTRSFSKKLYEVFLLGIGV